MLKSVIGFSDQVLKTQTGLYIKRRWLEACNFECRKKEEFYNIHSEDNGVNQQHSNKTAYLHL